MGVAPSRPLGPTVWSPVQQQRVVQTPDPLSQSQHFNWILRGFVDTTEIKMWQQTSKLHPAL